MSKTLKALIAAAALALAGSPSAAEDPGVRAVLNDLDGNRVGEVRLVSGPNGTLVRAGLQGLPQGKHGFHIHEIGKCVPPFKSAGGHFNPGDDKHGFLSDGGYHVGDMPNIHVPSSGRLRVQVFKPRLDPEGPLLDEDGAAIVIHQGADDYATDPAGAAGPRIACGVLRR